MLGVGTFNQSICTPFNDWYYSWTVMWLTTHETRASIWGQYHFYEHYICISLSLAILYCQFHAPRRSNEMCMIHQWHPWTWQTARIRERCSGRVLNIRIFERSLWSYAGRIKESQHNLSPATGKIHSMVASHVITRQCASTCVVFYFRA